MRYWAYLAGKVFAAAIPLLGLLRVIEGAFPAPPKPLNDSYHAQLAILDPLVFHYPLYACLLGWFLLASAALYFIVVDQKRRCRVCARKLRMPIGTGSWGSMLQLGRPRIESICPYGHGTLTEEELQISGLANPEWTPHSDNVWDELCAPGKDSGQEP